MKTWKQLWIISLSVGAVLALISRLTDFGSAEWGYWLMGVSMGIFIAVHIQERKNTEDIKLD